MTTFTIHTIDSAPQESKPLLHTIQGGLGFIPNLLAELAEAPAVLRAALALDQAYSASTLTPAEQQAVLIAVSVENRCEFCTSAHSFVARKAARMQPADIAALRAAAPLPTARLNALANLARALVVRRGWLDDAEVDAFLAQGFTRAQLLEVILGVTYKTLTNYANHLLHTPVNEQFKDDAWRAPVPAR